VEIVPLSVLSGDVNFSEYLCSTNNDLGEQQVVGLSKIAAFTKNPSLMELRQKEMRERCLKHWKVPDEMRRAPPYERPDAKIQVLFGGQKVDFMKVPGTKLTLVTLPKFIT